MGTRLQRDPQQRFQVIQSLVSTPVCASTEAPNGYSMREVCTALETSPSGYYAHWHKAKRPRRQEDKRIAAVMQEVYECGRGAYGSPRLVRGLRARGIRCGKARVRRLMREHGLCALQKKRFRVQTTQSNPYLPVAPNLLPEAAAPSVPGQIFCSDITYIPIEERHHLHSHRGRLAVCGRDAGWLFATLCWLAIRDVVLVGRHVTIWRRPW